MAFYVYAPDGKRYGPADLTTLQQWVGEGRILPQTMLEDEASGQRVAASAVPGLAFPQPQANPYAHPPSAGGVDAGYQQPNLSNNFGQSPYQNSNQPSNYYRPGAPRGSGGTANQDITNAWLMSGLQLICCLPLSIGGVVFAKRAKDAGHPNAQAAYIFSIVMLSLWVLLFIARFVLIAVMASSGGFN